MPKRSRNNENAAEDEDRPKDDNERKRKTQKRKHLIVRKSKRKVIEKQDKEKENNDANRKDTKEDGKENTKTNEQSTNENHNCSKRKSVQKRQHTVYLTGEQMELLHSIHMSKTMYFDQVRAATAAVLSTQRFYEKCNDLWVEGSNEWLWVHPTKESPVILESKLQILNATKSNLCYDLQRLILEYVLESDSMILDAVNEVWRWNRLDRVEKTHWLYQKAENNGVWYVIVEYFHKTLIGSDTEYIELVLQFLLHHKTDGLYDILLTLDIHAYHASLVLHAINQAWEMEHPRSYWCKRGGKELRMRDCTCSYCKQRYCHRSDCGCLARRRLQAEMLGEPVEPKIHRLKMDDAQLASQIQSWKQLSFSSSADCLDRIQCDLAAQLKVKK